MRIDLRDGIKDELDTKITLTLRWMFRIILMSIILGAVLFWAVTRQTKLDAAWYGKKWTCGAPETLKLGMSVYLLGYPGGSDQPTLRQGRVHFHRTESGSLGYQMGTWIVVFDSRGEAGLSGEAVVGGMSGAIVTDQDLNPVGILVTQNSPADLDGDGALDQSVDIVSLTDAYRVLIKN